MCPLQESAEYIRAKTLAAKLDCGESTVWRMVQENRLPQPTVRLGRRCTLWRWSDIQSFLATRAEEGNQR